MKPISTQTGFTLIEVLTVVAIISILSAIALPAYQNYLRRGDVIEAVNDLSNWRVQMEQYYQDNKSYANPIGSTTACGVLQAAVNASPKYFGYQCVIGATDQFYTITATGNAGGPVANFVYTINQSNLQVTLGTGVWGLTNANTSILKMKTVAISSVREEPRYRVTQSAFTLIEIMITLFILIVLISLALPTYSNWIKNSQVRTAAEATQNGLQLARAEAIRLNSQVQFSFTNNDWSIDVVSPASNVQRRTNSTLTPQAFVAPTPLQIVFNGLGQITPQANYTISWQSASGLCQPGGTVRCLNVVVQNGGQIRLCDPVLPKTDPQSC